MGDCSRRRNSGRSVTFRYKCNPCSKRSKQDIEFDFNHIPRDELAECPNCSSKDVEKIFAPNVAIVVKGASAANNYGLKPNRRKK